MKFEPEISDKAILIDGTSTIIITFEIGDVFIDVSNKIISIINIVENKANFIDAKGNASFESLPFNKEFLTKYRFAGVLEDNELVPYEFALNLVDCLPIIK